MSATEQRADASQQTDAAPMAAAPVTPFTMLTGDPNAMVCEDDVCYIPGTTPPA